MLVAETILVGAFSFTAFHSFSQGMTLLAFFYILFQSKRGTNNLRICDRHCVSSNIYTVSHSAF
jgi:hypothetical protein